MRVAEHRSAQCAFDRYADLKLTVPIAFDVRDYNTPQELTQIEATLQLIKADRN